MTKQIGQDKEQKRSFLYFSPMTVKRTSFLTEVAQKIVDENDDLRDVLVILPNRRASQYLNRAIARIVRRPTWSPKAETLSNWISAQSKKEVIASTESLFFLYKAYVEVYPDPDPFAEFFKWGQMILNDFNEIDRYLLQAEDVFKNLLEIQALESWSLEENELSGTQENFHAFWLQLSPLYQKFHELLAEENYTTSSHLFRTVANDLERVYLMSEAYSNIYFVGFNALSKAEEKIFNQIIKSGKGHVCVDVDAYYAMDEVHEAGHFYRRIVKSWGGKTVSQPVAYMAHEKIDFTVMGSPTNLGQVNAAMQHLKKIPPEEYADTVVVLADEDLIWPALSALPDVVGNVNVTMGVALKWTPLQSLLNNLLELQQSHSRMQNVKGFYYQTILPILHHPFIQYLTKKDIGEAVQEIITTNQIYISSNFLKEYFDDHILVILQPWGDWKSAPMHHLENLTSAIFKQVEERNQAPLEKEMMVLFHEHLRKLKRILDTLKVEMDASVFKKLFFQYWHEARIDLTGDPMDEIQIMGMLETRSLTFKNVIIMGLNEGTFPKTKKEYSIIPYDLKMFFQLPTRRDRDAIFANHFYRLVQRAENIFLSYGTSVEGIQENEKSRYITQLEYELRSKNKKALLKQCFHTPNTASAVTVPPYIEKTEEDVQAIRTHLEKGLSPSAFNTYLTCPMDYYYKYVLRLAEDEALEEEISNASFGTIVHNVLEQLYSDYIGKELTVSDVKQMLENYEGELQNQFDQIFKSQTSYAFGINKISYDVSKTYIEKFLQSEIERFQTVYKQGLTILALEEEYSTKIHFVDVSGVTREVTLRGKFDRVDRVGKQVRVIDYKTGKVEKKDTKLNFEKLGKKPNTKAHQLMMYALMYPEEQELEAGIFSMRNLDAGLIELHFGKDQKLDQKTKEQYKSYMQNVCKEMTNPEIPFEHNPDADYCERCLI